MGYGSRAILAGGLGFTVAFVVACGNSTGLLSSDQSSSLAGDLGTISSALASHNCDQVQSAATQLNNDVANLPQNVNPTLLQNLGQGAGTVSQLASADCSTSSTPTTTTTTTTTTSSTPTTTSSSTQTSTSSTPTSTSSSSSTSSSATNTVGPGTSTTSNGGAGIGGTSTLGNGGNGQ